MYPMISSSAKSMIRTVGQMIILRHLKQTYSMKIALRAPQIICVGVDCNGILAVYNTKPLGVGGHFLPSCAANYMPWSSVTNID